MTIASLTRAEPWLEFLAAGVFDPLWLFAAAALLVVGLLTLLGSLLALLRLRVFSFVLRVFFGATLLAAGALAALVAVGTAGYEPFTREEVAATIRVEPTGPQRFDAIVRLPDGRSERFSLAGDEILSRRAHPQVEAVRAPVRAAHRVRTGPLRRPLPSR